MPRTPPIGAAFDEWVSPLRTDQAVMDLSMLMDWELPTIESRIAMAVAEAAQTLRLLGEVLVPTDGRILEIGAGLGIASSFLASQGFDIDALEPSETGFDEHERFAAGVRRHLGSDQDVLTIGAEDLNRADHGEFQLIFSNNVLEHIADPDGAMLAMAGVLANNGLMIHSCANYSVPFEPHFGIPLLPVVPKATARILPRSIRDHDIWRSLNFIRARDIAALFANTEFEVEFRRGSLAASVQRLSRDPEFRRRHKLLGFIAPALERLGLIGVLRSIPPTLSTPMDFIVRHNGGLEPEVRRWLALGS